MDSPIPWEELRVMPDMDQEAWWREFLLPVNLQLVAKLVWTTGRSYTDCVVGLMGNNTDLLVELVRAKLARQAQPVED